MRKALIIGATSAIAQETAKLLAADGDRLYLVGRTHAKLAAVAADLKVRGAEVAFEAADLNDLDGHEMLIEHAAAFMHGLDTVLIAHGTMSDQRKGEQSFAYTHDELMTNLLSVISLLTPLANRFERQRKGTLAVISSVAGDRGRRSNYVYGTAKGALSIFLQGLRNRLHKRGVHVITIKPGFVDTPMTNGFEKGPLWVGPEVIARGIHRAMTRHTPVAYLPWFWR